MNTSSSSRATLSGVAFALVTLVATACSRSTPPATATIEAVTATPTLQASSPTAVVPTETPTPVPPTDTPTVTPGGGSGGGVPAPTQTPDPSPLVACGDILAPLDKAHRLAPDCAPSGLQELPASISSGGAQYLIGPAAAAIESLFRAAAAAGFPLAVNSSYRSYAVQVYTYNYWVSTQGRAYADRTSAVPGHSEHQLGTTADVGTGGRILENFSGTPAAAWLAANSWKFGFIVSYPPGKEAITGYAPEPWHIRWVGTSVAASVHASGLTLHEYLLR